MSKNDLARESESTSQPRAPLLLILDPARRVRDDADQGFSECIARVFCEAGFEVVWVLAKDDPLGDCSYAQLARLLPPAATQAAGPRFTKGSGRYIEQLDSWARGTWKDPQRSRASKGIALVAWITVRLLYRLTRTASLLAWWGSRAPRGLVYIFDPLLRPALRGSRGRRTVLAWAGLGKQPNALNGGAETELARRIASLDTGDVVVLPSADPSQIEMLLQLLPSLGLSAPVPATLHVRFGAAVCEPAALSREAAAMLVTRLRSGSPIRTIVLHGASPAACRELEGVLGLAVHESGSGDPAVLRRRFGSAPEVPPSLVVDEFGPVALLVSALWGRVGSSTVFDAQTRYLLERGFIVARILVDHYPESGAGGAARVQRLLEQNFAKVRPHFCLLAERNQGFGRLWRLRGTEAFRRRSPVARMGVLLADAVIDRPAAAAWCADRAVFTLVNHLPHVPFAERLAKAPILLETHDIFAKLLSSHGIPQFVPRKPDGEELRAADEVDVWRRVAACVNLSPDDHAAVAPVARRSTLVRPYVDRSGRTLRPWAEVVTANSLPESLAAAAGFDIMLWGDWHEGNVAGVRWFLEEVAARDACLRHASILLVGRVVKGLRRLPRWPRLYAVGFVDALDDFFARSTVVVIPDRPGSTGISIKAMDAFARGLCFASTTAGLRGLVLGDTGLAPSDDPAALAQDIRALLSSVEARQARAIAAHRLYDLNFSNTAYSEAWDGILDAVLGAAPGLASVLPAYRLRDVAEAPFAQVREHRGPAHTVSPLTEITAAS